MENNMVYLSDLRAAGYCSKGSMLFADRHQFDVDDFVKNGISFERLEEINSPATRKIIQIVRQKRGA